MITKVRYSKNLGKTIDYILNPKKGAHVVIARGVSNLTDIGILTEDFNRQCALRPSLKVKAVHIPISFHINDTATLEAHTEEIIGDWIKHMERHGIASTSSLSVAITIRTTRIRTFIFWPTWCWMAVHAPILPISERRQKRLPFP